MLQKLCEDAEGVNFTLAKSQLPLSQNKKKTKQKKIICSRENYVVVEILNEKRQVFKIFSGFFLGKKMNGTSS